MILKKIFELQDIKYRDFSSALIPNIDKERIIGVRTPDLKRLAKALYGSEAAEEFLSELPHRYFEENQLHAFLIALEKDFDKCLMLVNRFLPYIDNWATCDQLSPKCFYSRAEALESEIPRWCGSKYVYEVRFGIGSYMRYFLDGRFKIEYAKAVSEIDSDEYYIKMMIAWYFATALAKQYDAVFPIIAEKRLDSWTHNKAIQKAIESRRISDDKKEILRRLKV